MTQCATSHNPIILYQLSRLMKQRDLSPSELARKTGIPQPTIHRLLHNSHLDPRCSTLTILAEFFDVPLDYFLGKATPESQHRTHVISIYKLEHVAQYCELRLPSGKTMVVNVPHAECLGIESTASMLPRVPLGSILVIDTKRKPQDGDMVLVHYKEAAEYAMRVLLKDGPKLELKTLYTHDQLEALNQDKEIIGTAVQITTIL